MVPTLKFGPQSEANLLEFRKPMGDDTLNAFALLKIVQRERDRESRTDMIDRPVRWNWPEIKR